MNAGAFSLYGYLLHPFIIWYLPWVQEGVHIALFDQDISGWDTSNVLYMSEMFKFAGAFDQDLTGWCVEQIPSEPSCFACNTSWAFQKRPVWGEACD